MTRNKAPEPGGVVSGLFARLSFRKPAAAEAFSRDAGHVGLDVEDGRAVEHIDSANVELGAVAAHQLDDGQRYGVGATRGARGEYAVRALVERGAADQFEAFRPIESPDDKEMREALDVGQARLEFGEDFEDAFRIMFCAEALGNGSGIGVGAAHEADGSGNEHDGPFSVGGS